MNRRGPRPVRRAIRPKAARRSVLRKAVQAAADTVPNQAVQYHPSRRRAADRVRAGRPIFPRRVHPAVRTAAVRAGVHRDHPTALPRIREVPPRHRPLVLRPSPRNRKAAGRHRHHHHRPRVTHRRVKDRSSPAVPNPSRQAEARPVRRSARRVIRNLHRDRRATPLAPQAPKVRRLSPVDRQRPATRPACHRHHRHRPFHLSRPLRRAKHRAVEALRHLQAFSRRCFRASRPMRA